MPLLPTIIFNSSFLIFNFVGRAASRASLARVGLFAPSPASQLRCFAGGSASIPLAALPLVLRIEKL
jgi:hypothetical protein